MAVSAVRRYYLLAVAPVLRGHRDLRRALRQCIQRHNSFTGAVDVHAFFHLATSVLQRRSHVIKDVLDCVEIISSTMHTTSRRGNSSSRSPQLSKGGACLNCSSDSLLSIALFCRLTLYTDTERSVVMAKSPLAVNANLLKSFTTASMLAKE
ncbi:hypothetical protein BDZ89DRAFT_128939 [Hymenopellis radicata]|nr:hypothetical protein BDZ89DRAFT_128939 [Hymenopellis radicata]